MKKKRGLSPVIATVLLIAMVVVIGMIVFLWFRGMSQEAIMKFGENIELACNKINLEASFSGNNLVISNLGNIPISGMKVKIYDSEGNYESKVLSGFKQLDKGGVSESELSVDGGTKLFLTPVLTGETKSGTKEYTCNNIEYEVLIENE